MQKTYYPKGDQEPSRWVLIDADGKNLGRLASRVASLLLGKTRPDFTPGVDVGDAVIIVNAKKVAVTGKRMDEKVYVRASGYPGGLRETPLRAQLERHPERVIQSAVRGMLPKNRQGRRLMKRLHVYPGPSHPHASQKPVSESA